MHHHSTPSPREPRYTPIQVKFRTLRQRLQQMVNGLDDDERVYVNGQTFLAEDIRFLLTTMKEPKE